MWNSYILIIFLMAYTPAKQKGSFLRCKAIVSDMLSIRAFMSVCIYMAGKGDILITSLSIKQRGLMFCVCV